MHRHEWLRCFCVCLCGLLLSGCGSESDEVAVGEDPLLDAALDRLEPASSARQPVTDSGTASSVAKTPVAGPLAFSLHVNDRFPLRKTIDQTLVQETSRGPVTSSSRLTLLFAIRVEEEDQGRRRLAVRYQRVNYTHDLLGEQISYDSANPPPHVPDELQVYHGLADNGFSFWLGADNRIIEVIEFNEFLKRCVRHAPAHKRDELLVNIVTSQTDEGLANFVDDSIGLLPYNAAAGAGQETTVAVGEVWQRQRTLMRPLPMSINTTYTLAEMSRGLAQIAVFGTIEPATATELGPVEQSAAKQSLSLRGGFVSGNITIDRETGLPLKSRVERNMEMTVRSPEGNRFLQKKKVVTTVEGFPTAGTIYSRNEDVDGEVRRVIRAGGETTGSERILNADFNAVPPAPRGE